MYETLTAVSTRRFAAIAISVLAFFVVGMAAANAADDLGVVDERSGQWYLRDAETGETTSFYYGNPGDRAFAGDWDCDGVATPGLYRQNDGYVYLRNTNTQGVADIKFFFGNPGDAPLSGDFNGDGCDTVSLYRPSETRFFVINKLGSADQGLGAADSSFAFGDAGDAPIVGDWDGNGTDGVGVYRKATGDVHVRNSLSGGSTDMTLDAPGGGVAFVGSWTGNDVAAVYQTASGTVVFPDATEVQYGNSHTQPIAGNFGTLAGGDEAPAPPPPYPDVGSGKRIIYSNSQHQVWLIDENDLLVDTYPVTGRKGIPYLGTYTVFSKSVNAWAPYGGITMKHMVRFVRPGTWGNQWSYGFHSIPRYSNGQPMQTEAQLGGYGSGGCVRQADHKAAALFDWAPIGTVVHAIE
jgi:hypothetical protein